MESEITSGSGRESKARNGMEVRVLRRTELKSEKRERREEKREDITFKWNLLRSGTKEAEHFFLGLECGLCSQRQISPENKNMDNHYDFGIRSGPPSRRGVLRSDDHSELPADQGS
jgi:hypothetical protein